MAQRWHEVLFLHWALEPAVVRRRVPAALELDTHEGRAWIGVVPFRMSGVRLRGLPPVPGASAFPELNVRTYVAVDGRPGVYFFSLDAASPLAVAVARRWFGLPYYRASMDCRVDRPLAEDGDPVVRYRSRRTHRGSAPAELVTEYGPRGPAAEAAPGTLEHFLTARYCLYTVDALGRIRRGVVDHAPWRLQPAWADVRENTMTTPLGIALPDEEPTALYARETAVRVWAPRRA